MDSILREVVFRAAGHEYCWEDVVWAAECWGEWTILQGRVAAATAHLDELEAEGQGPTEEALSDAAEAFRYDRDLLTAEDLDEWLLRWNLSLEDWEDYLRRSLVDPVHLENGGSAGARAGTLPTAPEHAVWAEAACSGALAAWAGRLAGRAAIWARWRDESGADHDAWPSGGPQTDPGAGHRPGLSMRPDREAFSRLLEAFESAYDWLAARHLTSDAIADCIARRRADWTRLEGVLLTFDGEHQAREAAMLAREDGEPPEVVGQTSGAAVQEGSFLLEDLDPAVRDRLRTAPRQQWAGPFVTGDRFILLFVRERIPPLPADADIRQRAERSLLDGLTKQEVSRRVAWCQHP